MQLDKVNVLPPSNSEKLVIKFGPQRQLTGVAYHDGVLTSLAFSENDQMKFVIRNLSNELIAITLISVSHLIGTELREGNIVSDMFLWDDQFFDDAELSNFCSLSSLSREFVLAELSKKSMCLFNLSCSYGVSIYALCGGIEVLKGEA